MHPSARIPAGNAHFYTSSAPRAPLDPSTTDFVKGKPAIVQPAKNNAYYIARLKQHLDDWDKDLAEWHDTGEWKRDFKTWGAACEIALDMTRRAANDAIRKYKLKASVESVETGENSPAEPDTDKSETLATVNSLPIPPTETFAQRMNWELAESMQEMPKVNGQQSKEFQEPKTHKDLDGNMIPKSLLSTWNRRDEVQELMTLASKLRSAIRDLAGQSAEKNGHTDPLYAGHGWQAAMTSLDAIYYQLSECRPDVVCPNCKGTKRDPTFGDRDCQDCRKLGLVSEHRRTEFNKGGKSRKLANDFVNGHAH